ncbi:MAG: PilT/PilU family type 4a pilus ATPase [Byssovorax sp.]
MARIDSILSIVVQQGATELRLGTDREPKMLAHGTPKKLALPVTPDDMLRHLLGDLLSAERERILTDKGRLELPYDAGSLGMFQVKMTRREGEPGALDVVLTKGGARPAAAPERASPTPERSFPAAERSLPAAGATPIAPMEAPLPAPPASPQYAAITVGADAGLGALVARAARSRASDVHLLDGRAPVIRVDGALKALDASPIASVSTLLSACLDAPARARLDEGRSVDAALHVEGVGPLRINIYRAAEGLAAAIRMLSPEVPALSSLSLPVNLDDLVDLPHGLVIVCGPTGSGKSTTLAALAESALRRRSIALITLEDPIEYTLRPGPSSLVRQRQVGRDVKDFATGLRDALREDPDVLLIGEMRDPETISLALTAAETGHLVLTSLHSRSAASAVERIVDTYPAERQGQIRVQLADALRAVVAQRLLPRARGSGRVPALEVLRGTSAAGNVIREGKTAQLGSLIQAGKREGMIPLERCLSDLLSSGQITAEAARAAANEPASLSMYLGK